MSLLSIGESSGFAYGGLITPGMYTATCSIDIVDEWSRSSLSTTAGYPPHVANKVANHLKAFSLQGKGKSEVRWQSA
jgi:hypothetical protein